MDGWLECGRSSGWFVALVDSLNQVTARLSPAFDSETEARAALEVIRVERPQAVLGRDLLVRTIEVRS